MTVRVLLTCSYCRATASAPRDDLAQLEGWMFEFGHLCPSYVPLVLCADCAQPHLVDRDPGDEA